MSLEKSFLGAGREVADPKRPVPFGIRDRPIGKAKPGRSPLSPFSRLGHRPPFSPRNSGPPRHGGIGPTTMSDWVRPGPGGSNGYLAPTF